MQTIDNAPLVSNDALLDNGASLADVCASLADKSVFCLLCAHLWPAMTFIWIDSAIV